MAKFTDLPNELVIIIASFLRKPADILQLCNTDRRSRDLAQPLLYENIVFDHINYPTHGTAYQAHRTSSKIRLLCQSIRDRNRDGPSFGRRSIRDQRNRDGPSFGRRCRSLAINTNERLTYDMIGVCELVPFLRSFSLISIPHLLYRKDTGFAIDALGRALRPLRHTLEALTLFLSNQDHWWAAEGIGSLHSFEAMKKLRIQTQLLLGGDGALRDTPLLSQILPPHLEDLTIHCCDFASDHANKKGDVAHLETGNFFSTRTFKPDERFMGTDRRFIESVVVCLLDASCRLPRCTWLKLKKSFDIVGRREEEVRDEPPVHRTMGRLDLVRIKERIAANFGVDVYE